MARVINERVQYSPLLASLYESAYVCIRCRRSSMEFIEEVKRYSPLPEYTSEWYREFRCKVCGFVSRYPVPWARTDA